jgi:uncharacterized cupredoxin-like copper-binding protein
MTNRRFLQVMLAATVALGSTSIGSLVVATPGHDDAGDAASGPTAATSVQTRIPGTAEAPRDIAITMTDSLRFDPGTIVVTEGETIRFLLANPTVTPHDFLIGDLEEQLHHHEEMAAGEVHDDAPAPEGEYPAPVTLEPGESAEVIVTFREAGNIVIGCHVPGHWEAGMRGTIAVLPSGIAFGTPEAPREIEVTMTDGLRFDPGTIVVAKGETIRFALDNPTAAGHDFLIGDLEEQLRHHEEMAVGDGHDDDDAVIAGGLPPAITLEPGESADVIVTFDEARDLMIGCHVPGHWEAGMRGAVVVLATS